MGAIPCDDILDRYSDASEDVRLAVSNLLSLVGCSDSAYVSVTMRPIPDGPVVDAEVGEVASSLQCSAVSSLVIVSSLIRNFMKTYGDVWLDQLSQLVS